MYQRPAFLLALCLFLLLAPTAGAQEPFSPRDVQGMINAIRRANSVDGLGWSEVLALAAQRHAEELAAREEDLDHTGEDGSTPKERAARVGFVAYPDGVRASENFSTGNAMRAMAFFLESEVHRDNMLLPIWREVGVGRAESERWGEVWVVLFGAQPGVLPIFVNDDDLLTSEARVRVTLSSEQAGWSEELFTSPIEVRVGEPRTLQSAHWQAWQPEIPYRLSQGAGEKVVVVEYRDALSNTVQAQDMIFFVPRVQPQPTVAQPTATLAAPAASPSPVPSASPLPSATASPVMTLSPPPSTPTASAVPSATANPTASATATPLPAPAAEPFTPLSLLLFCLFLFLLILGLAWLVIYLLQRREQEKKAPRPE